MIHLYKDDQKFTHQSVPLGNIAPKIDTTTAFAVVDAMGTFLDTPENNGSDIELPVEGGVVAIPKMYICMKLAGLGNALLLATHEIHRPGNPTLASSFEGLAPNTWITPEETLNWTPRNHPIKSERFSLEQFQRYMTDFAGPKYGGSMAWARHSDPTSKLGKPVKLLQNAFTDHPNKILITKGEHPSHIIPGFVPEAYSGIRMVTGESLGTSELLRARGIKRVICCGISGANCEGETAYDLAVEGFDVWVVTDAQASITLPFASAPGWTMEEAMISRLLDLGVNFTSTEQLIRRNIELCTLVEQRKFNYMISFSYYQALQLI